MRLQSKINIFSAVILILMTLSTVIVGTLVIEEIVYGLNRRLLTLEIGHIINKIQHGYRVLQRSGVSEVNGYVTRMQEELVAELSGYRLGKTGRLVIVAKPDRVVLNTEPKSNTALDAATIHRMFVEGTGETEYESGKSERFCVFAAFAPWDWLIALSLTKDEMFEKRNEYIKQVSLIASVVLLLNIVVLSLFAKRLVRRIKTMLECAYRVEKGDLTARITPITEEDEIASLQRGFNSMISRMEEHTNEIRRAEAEVRRLNEELEARVASRTAELESANRDLQDFAYIVSHDLRAPLRAITRLAQWIEQDYHDLLGDAGKRHIELLQDRVRRMHQLIEGVLQYSRIGRLKEKVAYTDFNILVREAVELVAPPDRCKVTIDEGLPSIPCESVRISQVFQNLVDNAVKFLDKPQGEIRIGCKEEDTYWHFFVCDNGRGISPRYHDKVFQIFQTLGSNGITEGTGIGLTLVKKIVETAGGRIWVRSEPGQGSTFHFTLPKKDPELRETETG